MIKNKSIQGEQGSEKYFRFLNGNDEGAQKDERKFVLNKEIRRVKQGLHQNNLRLMLDAPLGIKFRLRTNWFEDKTKATNLL